jgi:hypothetical protein
MIAKIAPVDSQKRWNEKFLDTVKDLDSAEASLKNSCQQLNHGMVMSLLYCTYFLCYVVLYIVLLYYIMLFYAVQRQLNY